MAKQNSKFGRPALAPEDLPPHLSGRQGKTLRPVTNFAPEDYTWLGDDGNLDTQTFVAELTSPPFLLLAIVEAIVRGNSSPGQSDEDRIEKAMQALLGKTGKKGRRRLASDTPILNRMAMEYFKGFYRFTEPHASLSALADWALRQEPAYPKYSEETRMNRRRVLARKFEQGKDRFLTDVSSKDDPEVRNALSKIRVATLAIQELGISALPPDGTKLPELNP